MPLVACPSCRSTDHLEGSGDAGDRVVSCGACGHRWTRDLEPTCGVCGSTDLETVPTATLEEAGRGDQRTPSGIRDVHHCWSCGARDVTSARPLPPEPDWRERRSRARHVLARPASTDHERSATAPVHSAFGDFEVGAVVGGRWRLERLVRRSSTGTLWHAVATSGSGRVAFKLVHPRTPDPELHARSARAVAAVEHPALLRVLDVQQRHDDVLIVAERVDAPTLADRLVERNAPDRLSRLGLELASALAALHGTGSPHLDVRPASVLVPPDGPAKLVDLGAGRVRARTGRDPRAEERMAWLAPERIVAGEHTPAADVYGLGLTLWVAAGGRLEELGPTTAAQAQRRMREDLPPIPSGSGQARLAEVITVATRRRPAERPTAEDLADILR